MPNRVARSIAYGLLIASPLAVAVLDSPAQAAAPVKVSSDDPGRSATEKPDPAWKERYERVHEPREPSEQREAARERRTGGR
jgi:hypothetical protein